MIKKVINQDMKRYPLIEKMIGDLTGTDFKATGCDLIVGGLEVDKMIQRNVSRDVGNTIGLGKLLFDMNKNVTKALDKISIT